MKQKSGKGGRNERTARKLDRKKVLDLHARGLGPSEIAQQQGVAPSTVWRFLQRMKPELAAVEEFKQTRADVFARLGAKSLDLQERIIDTMDDGIVTALTPSQKSGFLFALNSTHGTIYDKERLERGQSTANVSLIGRMMGSALDLAHRPSKPNGERPGVHVEPSEG